MLFLARLISVIFSPLTLIPILFFLTILNTTTTRREFITAVSIIYGLGVFPVLVTYLYLRLTHRISDWGIYKREERYTISFIALVFGLLSSVAVVSLTTGPLGRMMVFFFILSFCFALITRFWKISAHAMAAALFAVVSVSWLPQVAVWSIPMMMAVAWARLFQKKHTAAQVALGTLLPLVLYMLAKSLAFL